MQFQTVKQTQPKYNPLASQNQIISSKSQTKQGLQQNTATSSQERSIEGGANHATNGGGHQEIQNNEGRQLQQQTRNNNLEIQTHLPS